MNNNPSVLSLDLNEIKKYQCNRYPLLFVDRITELIPGQYAKGIKCFSYNEWFFPAHFDDDPNVPGFIQIEALVQVFIMTFLTLPEYIGLKTSFISADNVKFRRKIIPGEILESHAQLISFKRGLAKGSVSSFVSGHEACSADFIVAIPSILNSFMPSK